MPEDRRCPYCKSKLEPWDAPPGSGWENILVCNNNCCKYYLESGDALERQGGHHMGYRYAEDPDNNYTSVPIMSLISETLTRSCKK